MLGGANLSLLCRLNMTIHIDISSMQLDSFVFLAYKDIFNKFLIYWLAQLVLKTRRAGATVS